MFGRFVSFEVITQRERLCYKPQCLAEMDVCMEEDSVTEELSAFIAPLSLSTQNVDSGRHLSHGSSWLQILQKFPYFRNPGDLSTVCTRLPIFSTHAQEPRSKAMIGLE